MSKKHSEGPESGFDFYGLLFDSEDDLMEPWIKMTEMLIGIEFQADAAQLSQDNAPGDNALNQDGGDLDFEVHLRLDRMFTPSVAGQEPHGHGMRR